MPSFLLLFAAGAMAQQQTPLRSDVVIYGGTPSGLAAGKAGVRSGASAIVIEPASHIGGMITGGIAITDTTHLNWSEGLPPNSSIKLQPRHSASTHTPLRPFSSFVKETYPGARPQSGILSLKQPAASLKTGFDTVVTSSKTGGGITTANGLTAHRGYATPVDSGGRAALSSPPQW